MGIRLYPCSAQSPLSGGLSSFEVKSQGLITTANKSCMISTPTPSLLSPGHVLLTHVHGLLILIPPDTQPAPMALTWPRTRLFPQITTHLISSGVCSKVMVYRRVPPSHHPLPFCLFFMGLTTSPHMSICLLECEAFTARNFVPLTAMSRTSSTMGHRRSNR